MLGSPDVSGGTMHNIDVNFQPSGGGEAVDTTIQQSLLPAQIQGLLGRDGVSQYDPADPTSYIRTAGSQLTFRQSARVRQVGCRNLKMSALWFSMTSPPRSARGFLAPDRSRADPGARVARSPAGRAYRRRPASSARRRPPARHGEPPREGRRASARSSA